MPRSNKATQGPGHHHPLQTLLYQANLKAKISFHPPLFLFLLLILLVLSEKLLLPHPAPLDLLAVPIFLKHFHGSPVLPFQPVAVQLLRHDVDVQHHDLMILMVHPLFSLCSSLLLFIQKSQPNYTMFLLLVLPLVSHPWCEHFYQLLSNRCDTEKGEREGKRHWTDNKNEVSSCAAWGHLRSHGLLRERIAC